MASPAFFLSGCRFGPVFATLVAALTATRIPWTVVGFFASSTFIVIVVVVVAMPPLLWRLIVVVLVSLAGGNILLSGLCRSNHTFTRRRRRRRRLLFPKFGIFSPSLFFLFLQCCQLYYYSKSFWSVTVIK
jgi:hypothetical protein